MDSKIKFLSVALVVTVALLAASDVCAAEKKGSAFRELCLKAMGMAKKTVEKEVNTVGYTIKKGTDVVAEEAKDIGKLATGKGKVKDVLEKPVRGATAVAGEAAYGVLHSPVEAGRESFGKDMK